MKALINAHVSARGVDPKIPPTAITDAEFERVLAGQSSSRTRAAQMQHAARYHIIGFSHQNPAYAQKMSDKLEEILQRFKDDWEALEQELARWTRSKLLWVHRTLARKEALAPKGRAPEFVSGENFSYLGQNYRLKIVREATEPLRFDGNHFWLAEDARSEAAAHFRR